MSVLRANISKNRDSCACPGLKERRIYCDSIEKSRGKAPRECSAAEREVLPAQNSDGEKNNRHGEIQQESESRDVPRPEQTPQ